METTTGAQAFVPTGADLDQLREAASGCRGCDLYRDATQTVFGRGPAGARVVLVGEQPGDVEDQRGLPFVGPAGHLLRQAVDDAGLAVPELYITNAVKHFVVYVQIRTARSAVHLANNAVLSLAYQVLNDLGSAGKRRLVVKMIWVAIVESCRASAADVSVTAASLCWRAHCPRSGPSGASCRVAAHGSADVGVFFRSK